MPGAVFTNTERKAFKAWRSATSGSSKDLTKLTRIEIEPLPDFSTPNPLRGIKSAKVNFQAPVSVLVGKNGSGKSTILQLSALAFKAQSADRDSFTFQNFFAHVPNEPAYQGFKIRWTYNDEEKQIEFSRRTTRKWMHYERRPVVDVLYLSSGRLNAPHENNAIRRAFGRKAPKPKSVSIDDKALELAGIILEKSYSSGEILTAGQHKIVTVDGQSKYSAFNMGAGESAVINLLHEISSAPANSLIVIDEIELGLHPAALAKLPDALFRLCQARNHQLICTSHSEVFIDSLPRESRILIQRTSDDEISGLNAVTTFTAMNGISHSNHVGLDIICEDELAKQIIIAALDFQEREVVRVSAHTADEELCNAAKHVQISESSSAKKNCRKLIVWDSDVEDKKIRKAYSKAGGNSKLEEWVRNTAWTRLPLLNAERKHGQPERVMFDALCEREEWKEKFAEHLRIDTEKLERILTEMRSSINDEHHQLFYLLAAKVQSNESKVSTFLIDLYVKEKDFDNLRSHVRELLDYNRKMKEFTPPEA